VAVKYVSSAASGSDDGTSATHTSGTIGPWTFAQALAATLSAGDEVRVMNDGTHSRSATGTLSASPGTNAARVTFTGANSSGVVDGTHATIQASAGSITLLNVTGSVYRFRYLDFDGNSQSSTSGLILANSYNQAIDCKALNCTSYGIKASDAVNSLILLRCQATGCSGTAGIYVGGAQGSIAEGCEAWANTTHGIYVASNSATIDCLSYSNTGASTDGFFQNGSIGARFVRCVSYGNGRGGFDLTGNAGLGTLLVGCACYGNTGEDYRTDGVKAGVWLLDCAGRAAGTGYNSTNLTNVEGYVTLSVDPFANSGSGNFAPHATNGASLKAAGYPGVFPRGTTTGYADIGVQHQDAGSTVIVVDDD
jgi:hypothetical protein